MCFKEATLVRPVDRFKMEAAYEKDKALTRSLKFLPHLLFYSVGREFITNTH
jgi:hypothetical protein